MNKRLIGLVIISIILLSSISAVTADEDKSYTINLSDIILTINADGNVNIEECYQYTFNGEFNGVYRTIPLKDGESIENLKVFISGAYSEYEVTTDEDGNYKITTYLYSDEDYTQPIKDTTVTVWYEYDFVGLINIYNDIAELHYKLWGEEWDEGTEKLNAHIQFNSSEGIEYWINPYYLSSNESWNGSELNIYTGELSAGEFLEFRALIPLSQFNENPTYAYIIDSNGREEIYKIQQDYENSMRYLESFSYLYPIVMFLSLFIPVVTYLRYGKEPKIDYDAPYEHEPPTNDHPLFVDAMFGTRESVGVISDNGIQATILKLIDEGILSLDDDGEEGISLVLNNDNILSTIEDYEANILNLFLKYGEDGRINLKNLKRNLSNQFRAREFESEYNKIKNDYHEKYINPIYDSFFRDKGAKIIKYYGISIVIVSAIVLGCISEIGGYYMDYCIAISIVFIFIGAIFILLNNRYGGQWTVEGRMKFEKWQSFRRYLNDFSLIKEHPPESIVIWNHYLIYASALGNADKVKQAMDDIIPSNDLQNNNIYRYHHHGGSLLFTSSMNTAHSESSSKGGGSVGGGSGGGGGGAF